jgi:hypothetical protein
VVSPEYCRCRPRSHLPPEPIGARPISARATGPLCASPTRRGRFAPLRSALRKKLHREGIFGLPVSLASVVVESGTKERSLTKDEMTCRRLVARPMPFAREDGSIREVLAYGYPCGQPSVPGHPERCAAHVPLGTS